MDNPKNRNKWTMLLSSTNKNLSQSSHSSSPKIFPAPLYHMKINWPDTGPECHEYQISISQEKTLRTAGIHCWGWPICQGRGKGGTHPGSSRRWQEEVLLKLDSQGCLLCCWRKWRCQGLACQMRVHNSQPVELLLTSKKGLHIWLLLTFY